MAELDKLIDGAGDSFIHPFSPGIAVCSPHICLLALTCLWVQIVFSFLKKLKVEMRAFEEI